MCMWEVHVYECGHPAGEDQRMAYSCQIWRRHVYGQCPFNLRQVSRVFYSGRCADCHARDNEEQRRRWRRTVM